MRGPRATYEQIPVASIDVGARLRQTDPAWVEALSVLINEQGVLHPISVVHENSGRYSLLAGAHRLDAVKALGWDTIDARSPRPAGSRIRSAGSRRSWRTWPATS